MIDFLLKIFGFIIDILFPNKLKQLQIRIKRLDNSNASEISDFMEIYEETFPFNGSNYTTNELLELLADPNNKKRHIKADNIFLIAKYRGKTVGFLLCFYYPEKQAGIVGYLGKTKLFKDEGAHVVRKLLAFLKKIVVDYNCNFLVFELEYDERNKSKAVLFQKYARELGICAHEINIEYYRPKLNLLDTQEKKLALLLISFQETTNTIYTKKQVIEILEFIHLCCYGDFYNIDDPQHEQFQSYLRTRLVIYDKALTNVITTS